MFIKNGEICIENGAICIENGAICIENGAKGGVERASYAFKIMMDFALKMMDFALKMMNFALKMMGFVFQLMSVCKVCLSPTSSGCRQSSHRWCVLTSKLKPFFNGK